MQVQLREDYFKKSSIKYKVHTFYYFLEFVLVLQKTSKYKKTDGTKSCLKIYFHIQSCSKYVPISRTFSFLWCWGNKYSCLVWYDTEPLTPPLSWSRDTPNTQSDWRWCRPPSLRLVFGWVTWPQKKCFDDTALNPCPHYFFGHVILPAANQNEAVWADVRLLFVIGGGWVGHVTGRGRNFRVLDITTYAL